MAAEEITIGNYIVRRLEEQNIRSIFGVPGSYLANFLDNVESSSIKWVGECNELIAAYAADGYARYRGGLGVLATTVGVGELSAINGVAGSFAEELPILHIVGQQPSIDQEEGLNVIHTLGDGKYDTFAKSTTPYICSQFLLSKKEIGLGVVDQSIDKVIVDCISKSRPAYIALPADLVDTKIVTTRLHEPLKKEEIPNNKDAESTAITHIYQRFTEAFAGWQDNNVLVIADVSISRHHCKKEVADFLAATDLPVYGTPLGKTVVDETSPRYGGVYIGDLSDAEVKKKVESARLVVLIGPLTTDFNSGKFSYKIKDENAIKIHYDHTEVGFASYARVGMKELLPKLGERLKDFKNRASKLTVPKFELKPVTDSDKQITHDWLWWRLGAWFEKNDLIITEAGSVSYGVLDLPLPSGSSLLAQKLWASIGWSMGATHGAMLARREIEGAQAPKTILFIGDGSFQMTVQEISGFMRSGINPIIFVITNGGYTIERLQHNVEGEYHNIVTWSYGDLLKVLASTTNPIETKTYKVSKETELGKLLDVQKIRNNNCLQLVEIDVGRDDAPPALRRALGIPDPDNSSADHGKQGVFLPRRDFKAPLGIIGW
ncbi:Pyruvate decarboxylase [Psilocybe cubensis]|uniref:Pyruvate decarboxylase n=2 Tax=Psilocybe cubensis TaxID=181762 RepID=A0A8H8CNB2_PSICU|nr:Pyruvate decarboxylase [Psilocybe cubensis]KAH9483490.1 Pyruvate decarboxylase [Psilocybe cubensis]